MEEEKFWEMKILAQESLALPVVSQRLRKKPEPAPVLIAQSLANLGRR